MAGRRLATPAVGGFVAVAVVSSTAAVVLVWTRADGFGYGGNTLAFVAVSLVLPLVSGAAAVRARRLGDRLLGVVLALTAGSLLLNEVSSAAAARWAGVQGRRDVLALVVVPLSAAGYVLPVALLLASCLVAAVGLGAAPWLRLVAAGIVGYATLFAVVAMLTLPVGPPFEDVRPVLPLPGADAWGWVLSIPWMAAVVVTPVLLWRSLPGARGPERPRQLLVSLAAMVPITTILVCLVLVVLAFGLGLLSVATGESVLAVAFGLPFLVCPPALAVAADRRSGAWVRRLTPTAVGGLLTAVVGTYAVILLVTLSAVVGTVLGPGSLLPVVLGTVVVAAGLATLRRRFVRSLVLRADPVRARAARSVAAGPTAAAHPADEAERVLRTALGDPGARLVLRIPDGGGWATPAGDPALAPEAPSAGRPTLLPDDEGAPRAQVVTSAPDEDVESAAAEMGPLLETAVLDVALRHQAQRLVDERARAQDATAAERRRLERDLHDGVQGRLLALALDLRMAQRDIGDGAAQLVLTDATEGLAAAIDELRALAAGDAPDTLSRHGLTAALADLARRMPVPITLTTPPDRLPPPVEAVVYLVVCEAVTNALKHARAGRVEVSVRAASGQALVSVSDDGRGGADLRLGSGLQGLSERVGAAGGQLLVSDRRPHGTTLEVTLPCG